MIHTSDISALARTVAGYESEIAICVSNSAERTRQGATCFVVDSANQLEPSQKLKGSKIKVLIAQYELTSTELSNMLLQYDYVITSEEVESRIKQSRCLKFNFINNRDQTIRWLMPTDSSFPLHLKLYNSRTWLGKFYQSVTRILFKMKLKSILFDGTIHVFSKNITYLERCLDTCKIGQFAAYLGIPGENRKCIIAGEVDAQPESTLFFKMPLTAKAIEAVQNESSTLKGLSQETFHSFVHPQSVGNLSHIAILTEMHCSKELKTNHFDDRHAKALSELYGSNSNRVKLSQSVHFKQIKKDLEKLEAINPLSNKLDWKQLKTTIAKMVAIVDHLDVDMEVVEGISHGDFTPWNMKVAPDKLLIYDWELSERHCPLLYDLFHYIVQSGVLLNKPGLSTITDCIEQALTTPDVQQLIEKHELNVALHYQLYILKITTAYLLNYASQTYVVPQAHWLVSAFEQFIDQIFYDVHQKTQRDDFMAQLFHKLSGKRYALLKSLGRGKVTFKDTSDIDLLIDPKLLPGLLRYIKEDNKVKQVKFHRKSYMTFAHIFFYDGSFLEVDLITAFRRKQINFMNAKEVLDGAFYNQQGIKLPKLVQQFEYIWLFYLLNKSSISDKHTASVMGLHDNLKSEILEFIRGKYGIGISNINELVGYDICHHEKVISVLDAHNSIFTKLYNTWHYVLDTLRDVSLQQGEMITFSGVDGAGKSTILSHFKQLVELKYRKRVKILRHRPSILPILSALTRGEKAAEQRSMSRLPRTGTNNNGLSSLLRFFYYYTDYLVGQWIIFFNYTLRGITVIYDRYYFDFMVDPRRSNIRIPKFITRLCFHFIRKPTLNVFLYANPEIILSRKKELSEEDIKMLTSEYRLLFNKLQFKRRQRYLSIENNDINHTLSVIEKQYVKNIAA